MEVEKKERTKKRKFGLYEFPRPLYIRLEEIELNDLTMKRIAAFIIDSNFPRQKWDSHLEKSIL